MASRVKAPITKRRERIDSGIIVIPETRRTNPYGVICEPPIVVSAAVLPTANKNPNTRIRVTADDGTKSEAELERTKFESRSSGKFVIAAQGRRSNHVALIALLLSRIPLNLRDMENCSALDDEANNRLTT